MSTTIDLTQQAPTNARVRTGGYAILARTADKARAHLAGKIGEYHFDCPLDNQLFGFKGVKGADFLEEVKKGASNEDLAKWLDIHGAKKTPEEVKQWGDRAEAYRPYDDPEKKEWFEGACKDVGIDPAKSTLFDLLEVDDRHTFKK